MGKLTIRLPDSLHRQLRAWTQREGVSINQLITLAVAEKMSALMAEEHIQQRASRAGRERYDDVLSRSPDRVPEKRDAPPFND